MAASANFMVPELRREREESKLDLLELTFYLDGGEELTKTRKYVDKIVCEDPVLQNADKYFLTREEALDRSLEKSVHYIKLCKELDLKRIGKNMLKQLSNSCVTLSHGWPDGRAISEEQPISLHEGMFIPTIQGQATDEQKRRWLEPALNYKIIGAYAQTELGHGSNVRGLETTAIYDENSREFIINTPTLTATKFWPGTLGHIATHAVVLARLITKGVDHGIHPFIMQIRSLKDHTPLLGVTVGDIGPKMGYLGMDNGFLSLDHVRIPRDQMLMKYSQVKPDGTYVKPPQSKIVAGLAKAVTIATRYSVVRKQGQLEEDGPEVQVLDYQTQQLKLLPLIAAAYALNMAGLVNLHQYIVVQNEIELGNFDHMQENHATTCGMKAFSTDLCIQGMEMCRQACGGHGYSRACGIPDIYSDFLPSATYEGDNTILYLQTARYLNKMISSKQPSSKLPVNISYLGQDFKLRPCSVRTAVHFMDPYIQLEVYEQRARRMVDVASDTYQRGLRCGLKRTDAWNQSTCDWVAASRAHCHYITLKAFRESLEYADLAPNNLAIINSLCCMFATHGITTYTGEFMTAGYMSPQQVSLARDQLYSLMKEVRREAVPLVDAFDIPDGVLNSVLGRYDGNVYTHLLEWAKRAPRNKKPVHDVYDKHLKKLLHSKL